VKKGIVFQIFAIIVILTIWNAAHYICFLQKQHYEVLLEKMPIIAFSNDLPKIEKVASVLDSLDYIAKTVLEKNNEIASRIIENYDLKSANKFIDKSKIPNVLKVFFHGDSFNEKQKYETMKMLSEITKELNFNDYNWQVVHHKLFLLHKIHRLADAAIILLLLFIFIFLRIHFEINRDDFWKIYFSAGGKYSTRRNSFIVSSLILCFVPLILIVGAYFALVRFGVLEAIIPWNLIIPQIITLIVAAVFSTIFLGKRVL